jgi:hypothetical protein
MASPGTSDNPVVHRNITKQFYFLHFHSYQTISTFLDIRTQNILRKTVLLLRMSSSGMLRHVALVRTDVSEELSTSFIRVTRIGELGTALDVTSNPHMLRRNTSVLTGATQRNIPEDTILHSHCSENLKSYIVLLLHGSELQEMSLADRSYIHTHTAVSKTNMWVGGGGLDWLPCPLQ